MNPSYKNIFEVIPETNGEYYLYVLFVKTFDNKYIRVCASKLRELLDRVNRPVNADSSLIESELRNLILAGSHSILFKYNLPDIKKDGKDYSGLFIRHYAATVLSMGITKVCTCQNASGIGESYDIKFHNAQDNIIEFFTLKYHDSQ